MACCYLDSSSAGTYEERKVHYRPYLRTREKIDVFTVLLLFNDDIYTHIVHPGNIEFPFHSLFWQNIL